MRPPTARLQLTAGLVVALILAATSAQAEPVSEIVVLLRGHRPPTPVDDPLPATDAEIQELSRASGLALRRGEMTPDGAQRLQLPEPMDTDALTGALRALRNVEGVLYAEPVERPDRATLQARAKALTQRTSAEVTELVVKLADREARRASMEGRPLDPGVLWSLSVLAGAALSYSRPMSGGAHVLAFEVPVPIDQAHEIAARIASDPGTTYADPVRQLYAQVAPNDPHYSTYQWDFWDPNVGINIEPAWERTVGDTNVVVAVLDTGLLFNHPDLAGAALPGYDFVRAEFSANDGDGFDGNPSDPGDGRSSTNQCGIGAKPSSWHGSHVAGTIGANTNNTVGVAGINRGSFLLPVRVLGRCGGSDPDIIDGIYWAAGLSAPSGTPVNSTPAKVINMSLGGVGACPPDYQSAINDAVDAGSTIIVSAGNDHQDLGSVPYTPASCNGVIVVAAHGSDGERPFYTNFGGPVAISAPGGSDFGSTDCNTFSPLWILSVGNKGFTVPAGDSYCFKNGTSMAAPHVAGVASLMVSLDPSLSPLSVKAIIENTARPFLELPSQSCTTSTCGAGYLDAGEAVAVAALPENLDLHVLPPCRLIDTRDSFPTDPSSDREIQAAKGGCGIPKSAKSLVANVTVVAPAASGFLTVYPGDQTKPTASTLNFRPGVVRANNAMIPVSRDGLASFWVYNGSPGSTHFIVDVSGYFL